MTMFIQFFFVCPLSLTIKLNFNISKVAYWNKKINGGHKFLDIGPKHESSVTVRDNLKFIGYILIS